MVEKEGGWGAKSRIYMLALEIDIPCPVSQSDSESIFEEHNQSTSNKVLQWAEFEVGMVGQFRVYKFIVLSITNFE